MCRKAGVSGYVGASTEWNGKKQRHREHQQIVGLVLEAREGCFRFLDNMHLEAQQEACSLQVVIGTL